MKSCFMFGHADTPDSILPVLENTIELYFTQFQIQSFYVGNRGSFDRLATTAAKRVKQRYPELKLYLLLAYHPAEQTISLSEGFDSSFYPPLEGVPRKYAIVKANKYMVDNADSIICYVKHIGNTRNLLEYAQKRKMQGEIVLQNLSKDV